MSTSKPASTVRLAEIPFLCAGLARTHIEAVISHHAPPRAVIVGPAGSGKSRVLRHLRRELASSGLEVTVTRSRAQITATPADHVLVVDDAHLLDEPVLSALVERVSDPDAALVLTARPWPRSEQFGSLVDELERAQPAIVLGGVGRTDLRAYAAQIGERASEACLDAMLDATGGTSWLVSESLAAHRAAGCTDAARHDALDDALRDVIAHRLRTVDPEVRAFVERVCLSGDEASPAEREHLALSAYADGLLLRGGRPAPVVRSAVRATASVDRVIRLYDDAVDATSIVDAAEADLGEITGGVRDSHLAGVLLRHGDTVRSDDARRARDLYRRAREAGADAVAVAAREAQAEWELGDVEAASRLIDAVSIPVDHPDHDAAADIAAAIWAARGLASMSDAVYRVSAPTSSVSLTRAAVAAFAVGDTEPLDAPRTTPAHTMPSTLAVSMELLSSGLRATTTTSPTTGLSDLVRAAEMYSSAGDSSATTELPAVVAALAALHSGEPDVALTILDRALRDVHAGAWAQDRLVLWRAWVALQLERAHEVEAALETIAPRAHTLSPRERMLYDAVSVSIARRYHDAAALTTAWRSARESLMRTSFDVFGILPLGEFVVSAARVGEPERVDVHFTRTLALLDRLGSPPLWTPHAHWAGLQRAILRGRPDDMVPHAQALVGAASHSHPAAIMAHAGRVWTTVLSGTVDADAVERAAISLGGIGLAWDGARLAGHGAGHTDDRRIGARLLATARGLHPHEDVRPPTVDTDAAPVARTRAPSDLSPRELEVAALVVQGKTYAEIGAAIFISPRTAEHHIARIRRRLGATNRSDLIAKLRVALDDADDPPPAGAVTRASA